MAFLTTQRTAINLAETCWIRQLNALEMSSTSRIILPKEVMSWGRSMEKLLVFASKRKTPMENWEPHMA